MTLYGAGERRYGPRMPPEPPEAPAAPDIEALALELGEARATLVALLRENAAGSALADEFPTTRSSSRNKITGLVTRIQVDGIMAQVDLQAGPFRVVSLMSREAVEDLGLEVGMLAVASVKATTVSVELPAGGG